jgi:putative transposase
MAGRSASPKSGALPIAIRLHRPLAGTPKTVTISREADGWYACSSCVEVPIEPLPRTNRETGIDVGLKVFLVTADGEAVANPRHYRTAEQQLAKAHRRVSRRTKGSTRRRKAVRLLASKQQKVKRQRTDFHHKTALALPRTYDVVYLEDLQVRNLVRNHHLAKRISDAGWAAVRTILTSKAASAGTWVVAVPAQYTSQDGSEVLGVLGVLGVLADGSRCVQRVAKSLSVRTHVCPSCGLVLDRDLNAAQNIQWAGQALGDSRGCLRGGTEKPLACRHGEHVTERFNGTMRKRLASLTRRCRHEARRVSMLEAGMWLVGCTHNWCWPHHELSRRLAKEQASKGEALITPAMASGLTDHIWSVHGVLTCRISPPP